MNGIYLLLGTNEGERLKNLEKAVSLLRIQGIRITRFSSVYETEPWGIHEQPWFLNLVLEITTDIGPVELLKLCLNAEKEMGRERLQKWGQRLIDIDILFYQDVIIQHAHLRLPHPELPNRRFALMPLVELAPEAVDPRSKKKLLQLFNDCSDTLECRKTDLVLSA